MLPECKHVFQQAGQNSKVNEPFFFRQSGCAVYRALHLGSHARVPITLSALLLGIWQTSSEYADA